MCPEGGVGTPQRAGIDSGTLMHSFTFSVLQCIMVYICPVKWIYGLYYLVFAKLQNGQMA